MSQACIRLNEYLEDKNIDAVSLHRSTGIDLRKCYRIKQCEGSITLDTLAKIKKAYPKISLTYIILGSYPLKKAS